MEIILRAWSASHGHVSSFVGSGPGMLWHRNQGFCCALTHPSD